MFKESSEEHISGDKTEPPHQFVRPADIRTRRDGVFLAQVV